MITRQDILDQKMYLSKDICELLDGYDDETLDEACQIIDDRFDILLMKFDGLNIPQ